MSGQDAVYKGYKFSSHVGYGTAVHRAAIKKRGVTPLHRLSAPLHKYRSTQGVLTQKDSEPISSPPSNYMGTIAEDVAAEYLRRKGHEIS